MQRFNLDRKLLPQLPPDLRDSLLEYCHTWGDPQDTLALVDLLREVHGPLLFLLDYQTTACLKLGRLEQAIESNERRQRRSQTIGSQGNEARILLAMGRSDQALVVVDDLVNVFPNQLVALHAAADVYAACGRPDEAAVRLVAFLATHPGNLSAILLLARLTYNAGKTEQADEYVQLVGSGMSPNLDEEELRVLAGLLEQLGKQESARAVQIELARRQEMQWAALHTALQPYTLNAADAQLTGDEIFRRMSGPESAPATREEIRKIELAAARHFGFSRLRPGQAETIACVLRGESLLAVMPTGAGKSLCYQVPALMSPRTSLVISPLIALMKDQVDSLPPAAQARATFINSTLSDKELADRIAGINAGDYKLVYAAPERLRQRDFLRSLRQAGVDLFIIDEAHCVSLWGHDFRPDYLFLQEARRELDNPITLAMTATAPPRVRDEILDYMRDEADQAVQTTPRMSPRVITLDIFRPNLHLSALRFGNEEEKLSAVLKFVTETTGSGIVYVNTRHKAEALAFALRQAGVAAEAYHAGLENRAPVQDRFMANETRVVVATVAFGMGIDKSDIRFIVHFHPSRSLAGYYQEVGRAGRDGALSQGVLFYSNNDWANLRRWAKADEYSVDFLEKIYWGVAAQLGVSSENTHASSGGLVDARRLQQVVNAEETAVRVVISILERADLLTRSFDIAQEVVITLSRSLPAAARNDHDFRDLLAGLKLAPGQSAAFRLVDIARFMGWSPPDCESVLVDWHLAGYLQTEWRHRAMYIALPTPPSDRSQRLERLLAQAAGLAQRRIDEMVGYATTDSCRHGYISAHFGSPPRTRCTVCDNCTGVRPDLPVPHETPHLLPDDADIEPMIIDCLISLPRPVGRSGLARILVGHLRAGVTPDQARHHGSLRPLGEGGVMEYIDDLLEQGRLRQYERQGFLVLAPTMSGRSEAEVWLDEHPEMGEYGPPPSDADAPKEVDAPEAETYTELQKALWLWRRRTAGELNQPPYMVMSNELMLQIAETRPQSLDELSRLQGMGEHRLRYYGPTILDIVKLHPIGADDAALLAAQRANPPAAPAVVRNRRVTPAVEKRIFMKLQELRQQQAVSSRRRSHEVASNTLLKEIARQAPVALAELEAIPGFRTSGFVTQGTQIVTFIALLQAQEK